MEAHLCNHPLVPHTVEYLVDSQKGMSGASVVVPQEDLEDADIFAQKIIRQNPGRLLKLKIYRSDNPTYSCFVWDNPQRGENADESQKVKLEVDMEPLASAFDNVRIGFEETGKKIRNLWVVQGALIFVLMILCVLVVT